MHGDQHNPAQPLADIVANRLPWFRARLSTILIWPILQGGWTAILSYAHYTTLQRGETPPSDNNVTYPHDTHHPLAFDGADAAAIHAQVRDLERTGAVGRLRFNRVAAPRGLPVVRPRPAGRSAHIAGRRRSGGRGSGASGRDIATSP